MNSTFTQCSFATFEGPSYWLSHEMASKEKSADHIHAYR
jgi:hypothetical protein